MISDPKHPMFGASLKLDRAAEQLQDLMAEMKAFMKTDFYETWLEFNEDSQALVTVIRYKNPPPPKWSVIIGEITHNLRSTLDYLVFQMILLQTGKESTSNKIQFPIFDTESGFNSRGDKMLEGLDPKMRAFFRSLQPFATGEGVKSPLWHLSKLSNRDKHRDISVAFVGIGKARSSTPVSMAGGGVIVGDPSALKEEAVLYGVILPPSSAPIDERIRDVNVDCEATLHIVFKEPATQRGLRADELLDTIGKRVFDITERISAEFFVSPPPSK